MDGSERPKLEITQRPKLEITKQAKDQVAFRIASELQKKLGTTTILPTARADELTAEQLRNPAIQADLLSAMHVARHTAGTDEGVTRKNVDDEIREFIHKDILGYSKDDPLKETDTREALEERAAELFQVAAAKLSRFYRGYKDRRDLKEHFQKNINESKQVQRKTYPLGGPKDSLRNVDEVDDLGVPETTEDVDATAAAARLKEIRENIAKRQLEEAIKARRVRAATAIQAVWRGRRVREEIEKANKLPEPPAPDPVPDRDPAPPRAPASGMVLGVYPPEDPRHLPATIIQTAFRGYQARKNFKKLQDDSRVQAAITIQRAWRRYRGKIAARRPENYPKIADDLARIEEGRAAAGIDKFTGYPKDLDRGQIAAEATAAFVGKRFDPFRGKFVDVTGPQRSLQNNMLIDGIYGHQPKARGAKDEHLSIGRSPAYPTDSLELHASGFIIAKYQGPTELQHAIAKRRRQHYLANKDGKPLLSPGEVRVGFVSHPRYQFNARGERVDTDNDQTILLIETAEDGLTEVFADAKVMQDIQDRCHRTFADPKKYKTLMSAALDACKGITDDKERQTTAEKMVREAVRDMVMKEMVQEIKQARERLNVPALTDMQVHDITRTTGGGHKFEGGLKKLQRDVPNAVSSKKHSGIAVSESRFGAKITFTQDTGNDIFWKNIPGTSFFVRVKVAQEDGPIITFIDGQLKTVDAKKGDVFVDKNTIHFHNGVDYSPLCVHDNPFTAKSNSLRHNAMARYQGGPKGYEGIRKMYDKFNIQASSDFGDKHKVAIKIGAKVANQVTVTPTMSKGADGNPLVFTRQFFSSEQIDGMDLKARKKAMEPKDEFVVCPDFKDEAKGSETQIEALKALSEDGRLYARVTRVGIKSKLPNGTTLYPGIYREFKTFYVMRGGQMTPITLEDAKKNPKIGESWFKGYAEEYFRRVNLDYKTDDQVAAREEELRAAARGHRGAKSPQVLADLLAANKAVREAIEAKAAEMTTEERDELLSGLNFDLDARDPKTGKTAMHHAAERGDAAMVKALIDAGANANVLDLGGKTPAALARNNGHFDANKKGKDNFILVLEDAAAKSKAVAAGSEKDELERNCKVLEARVFKLRDDVVALQKAVEKAAEKVYKATQYRAAAEAARTTDGSTEATFKLSAIEEKDAEKAAKKAKIDELAARMKLSEAEKELVEAEKKLAGQKAPEISPKARLATPENCDIGFHRIVVDAKDDKGNVIMNAATGRPKQKYIEIPFHLVLNDKDENGVHVGCAVERRFNGGAEGGGKTETVIRNAGDIVLDYNTVRFYYDDKTAGFAFAKATERDENRNIIGPAETPKGWNGAEWKDAIDQFKQFVETFSAANKATQMRMINASQEFQDIVNAPPAPPPARLPGGPLPAATHVMPVASTGRQPEPDPVQPQGSTLKNVLRILKGKPVDNPLNKEEGIKVR